MTSSASLISLALIGGGPRAVAVLERLGSALAAHAGVQGTIHLIDDVQPGAGRVWRTDQPRELCMNTLAHAVSLFPDESVRFRGDLTEGPTLHEWSLLVSGRAGASGNEVQISPKRAAMLARVPVRAGVAEDYAEELAAQRPEFHPSRALYGEYIAWCYAWARAALPAGVQVIEHRARAVAVVRRGDRQAVLLDDGSGIDTDGIALVPGWLPAAPSQEQRRIAEAVRRHPGLVWIAPDSPIDQPLERIPDGADVIVRGLGMGFFDAMALLTLGRGGRFIVADDAPSRLRYVASGREPVLHVTSHRGLPFRAKSLYGGLPPHPAQHHLRAAAWLEASGPVDFAREAWPLVLKDALDTYCRALGSDALTVSPDEASTQIGSCPVETEAVLATADGIIADRAARRAFHDALATAPADAEIAATFAADDLAEAEQGRRSALKAALWSISAARTVCARAGAFGRFTPDSLAAYRRLHAIGGMAGSGPPAFRSRQLLAVAQAGLVRFLGGAVRIETDGARFVALDAGGACRAEASVLLDAFMRFHDAEASADPLFRQLADAGRVRAFRIGEHRDIPTGGVEVEPGTWRVIDREGRVDPTMFLAGIPLEQTIGDTIISPMPGANSTMLRECDAVALGLAAVLGASAETAPAAPAEDEQ